MENKVLILTVGLPRSGKTTWARGTGHPIVNPDSIRLALHGKNFEALAEPVVWAIAKIMVRALFLAGHDTVILDACNVTADRRREWISRDWETKFLETDRPLRVDLYKERAIQIGRPELIEIIDKMAAEYDFGR